MSSRRAYKTLGLLHEWVEISDGGGRCFVLSKLRGHIDVLALVQSLVRDGTWPKVEAAIAAPHVGAPAEAAGAAPGGREPDPASTPGRARRPGLLHGPVGGPGLAPWKGRHWRWTRSGGSCTTAPSGARCRRTSAAPRRARGGMSAGAVMGRGTLVSPAGAGSPPPRGWPRSSPIAAPTTLLRIIVDIARQAGSSAPTIVSPIAVLSRID